MSIGFRWYTERGFYWNSYVFEHVLGFLKNLCSTSDDFMGTIFSSVYMAE